MKTLLMNKPESSPLDISSFDILAKIDENYVKEHDIFCFIPNRNIISKTKYNICFIPYSPHSFEYKNAARATRYKLGEGNSIQIDSDFGYILHRKIGLSHIEEVNILMLALQFLIDNSEELYLQELPTNLSPKEYIYFEGLLSKNKVKLL